ncbi:hypothetical protein [Streptomyces murinus]|uniref:hypothetical protein n=1 Tax=Streptomyces murinus TaxID=33900 RepID=UPI00381068CE
MVAVNAATGAKLLSQPVAATDEVVRRLRHALSRSLAADGIGDDLIGSLEEVLSDRPALPTAGRWFDGLLMRLGLPLPPLLPPAVTPLSEEAERRLLDKFRRATRQLIEVVPHRVTVYPTAEVRHLLLLCDGSPAEGEGLPYLRRYALAILAILDVMGDDA